MNYFGSMASNEFFVHPSSVVDEGALIGKGTRIWHFCHVSATSKIGDRCNLGQNVYIDSNAVIGNGVKIQNNVSVYNGVIIEDDVFLGPSMVFTNVINPRSFIERKNEFKQTIVRRGATIGANATILCGIEIGRYALIGAGAVVTKNVLAYAIITGNPARQSGWVSEAGIKLNFNATGIAKCPQTGKLFKLENGIVEIAG
ncbi:MAG TPA: acyltransferase [Chitinophagaceae bacterium]|nr:acyltransferase [Chitinophagaceae bacterium]